MLTKRLDRLATTRNVVTSLVVALILLLAANLFSSQFYDLTGGYGLLDLAGGRNALTLRTGYSANDAYELLTHWGTVGRRNQVVFTLTLDVVVPAATWLFLTLALLRLTRLITAASWLRSFAVLLPIAYLFSDYSENIAIVAMVWHFPSRLDGVAAVASALWIAKTVTSDLAVCVLLLGVMARLVWLCLTSRGWLSSDLRQRLHSRPRTDQSG
jgi:hypothetical protein